MLSALLMFAYPTFAQDYNEDCGGCIDLGNISSGYIKFGRQCMEFGSWYTTAFAAQSTQSQEISLFVKTKGFADPVQLIGVSEDWKNLSSQLTQLDAYNVVANISLPVNKKKEWSIEVSEDYNWEDYRSIDYKLICLGTENQLGTLTSDYRKEVRNVAFSQVLNIVKTEGQIISLTVNSVESFWPCVLLQQLEYGERKTVQSYRAPMSNNTVLNITLPQEMHGEYCLYIYGGDGMLGQDLTPLFDYTLTCIVDKDYLRFRDPGTASYVRTRTYMDETGSKVWNRTQYYNGLGFPTQLADEGNEVVTLQEYDNQGREVKRWLPVCAPEGGKYWENADVIRRNARNYYADEYPFMKTCYEASPREEIDKLYNPGCDWQGYRGNRYSAYHKMSNNDTLRCRRFKIVSGALTCSGFYAKGTLAVSKSIDEDYHVSYLFTDVYGKTILSRQVSEGVNHDTYYVYDNCGNLCYVLPPMVSDTNVFADNSEQMKMYAYLYRYDSRNRCVFKRLPGCDSIIYTYDASNQLIFSQNGEQRKQHQWQFSIPDAMGRIVLTGLCENKVDVSQKFITAVYTGSNGILQGYDLKSDGQPFMLSVSTLLSVIYYDSYEFLSLPGFQGLEYVPDAISIRYGDDTVANRYKHKGLLTGMRVAVLGDDRFLNSALYYDERQRLTQTRKSNILGGVNSESSSYSFTDKIKSKEFTHTAFGKSSISDHYNFAYDDIDQPIWIDHDVNNEAYAVLQERQYDYLGRLSFLRHYEGTENVTYQYNLCSWITSIKSEHFDQQLYYAHPLSSDIQPCYSGDISSMTWQVGNDSILRCYNFDYDGMKRMRNAYYGEGTSMNMNKNGFAEQVTGYDKNGNILGLKRYGQIGHDMYGLIDDLTYTLNGNQLETVNDAVMTSTYNGGFEFKNMANTIVEYGYDANGNLTKDLNKEIVEIQYNLLNLPNKVVFLDGSTISYLYSADGTKLRATYAIGGITTTRDYCDNVIYENGVATLLLTINGYMSLSDRRYHYYVQDHQGNNRIVIDQDGNLEEVNHYYPFGGVFTSSGNVQPYKYNGKELDSKKGLDWYDYGARHYDSALGRWLMVDPIAEKYSEISPYVYCANSPVRYVDPTGMYFDEANEKKAQKLERKIDSKISKLEKKAAKMEKKGKDVGDLSDRIAELKNSKSDISDMRKNQKTEFRYAKASAKTNPVGQGFPVTTVTGVNNAGHKVVTMYTEGGMGNQLHESRHGGQVARNEYSFDQHGNPTEGYGVKSEVSAYRAQYSYDGKLVYIDASNVLNQQLGSTGITPPLSTVPKITDITLDFVRTKIGEVRSAVLRGNRIYGLVPIYEFLP